MVVKGTTVEAFSSLIRFIYNVPGYISPADDRQKLVEIHQVAENCQVSRLVEEVRKMLIKLPIKVENVSKNIFELENTVKADHMSEDIVDHEMSITVENLSEDFSGYENAVKVEPPSDVNIKLENDLEDPLNIENKMDNFCDPIKIESQFSIPTASSTKKLSLIHI